MKNIVTLMLLLLLGMAAANADSGSYRLNEAAVDQMFAEAEQVEYLTPAALAPFSDYSGSPTFVTDEKNPAIAFVLAWAIGYLGIHRAYLGTSTGTIIAYIITGGGCGVVWLVDWVVLLIGMLDDDIAKYVDNPKFFMW